MVGKFSKFSDDKDMEARIYSGDLDTAMNI